MSLRNKFIGLFLIVTTQAIAQNQLPYFNPAERAWFSISSGSELVNSEEENFDYAHHYAGYYGQSGDYKRVFNGEKEQVIALHSEGRKNTKSGLILAGEVGYHRQSWKGHQFNLNPNFGQFGYQPYYTGPKVAVYSFKDNYDLNGAVYKQDVFNHFGLGLGFHYNASHLFGTTDPSGNVQDNFYAPRIELGLYDAVNVALEYQKFTSDGSFKTKNDSNSSLETTNPYARFFYTGYGTRLVTNLTSLQHDKKAFQVDLSSKSLDIGHGQMRASVSYNSGKDRIFRFDGSGSVTDKINYARLNTENLKAIGQYQMKMHNADNLFIRYQMNYDKAEDKNEISGNNLRLYKGNDYFHQLDLGYIWDEEQPLTANLHVDYNDISRYEVGKIAFVNKNLAPQLQIEKQWLDKADWSVMPNASIGYNFNLESEMVLTGDAGSNSPFFIQQIAIPETLYYRNNYFDFGIGVNTVKSFKKVKVSFDLDYNLVNANGNDSYEGVTNDLVNGKRNYLNATISIFQ